MRNNTEILHQQAEQLREQDKHLEALRVYEEVIISYQKQENYSGMVETLMGRCLAYKHLYLLTGDLSFATIARHSALSGLDIAKGRNLEDKIYRCNFRLGEMEMLFQNYSGAVDFYTKALSGYPRDEAEKGDFQYHLGEAQYKNGDCEEGKKNLIEGVKKIEDHESSTDSFVFHVWLSGGYKTLADLLWNDSPTEARNYLNKAEKIINGDDRLIIRKRQLGELKKKLSSV